MGESSSRGSRILNFTYNLLWACRQTPPCLGLLQPGQGEGWTYDFYGPFSSRDMRLTVISLSRSCVDSSKTFGLQRAQFAQL